MSRQAPPCLELQDVGLNHLSARGRQVKLKSAQLRQDLIKLQVSLNELTNGREEAERHVEGPAAAGSRAVPSQAPAPAEEPAAPRARQLAEKPRRSRSKAAPSTEVLGSLFDLVCKPGMGSVGLPEVQQAIDLLNLDYNLGLQLEDAPALLALLQSMDAVDAEGGMGVSRGQFIEGLSKLTGALERLGTAGFNISRMKAVLVAVFERFDVDKDGTISEEEFLAGLSMLGLDVGEDASILHRFFSPEQSLSAESLMAKTSLEEQATSILKGGMDLLSEKFNFGSFANLGQNVGKAMGQSASNPAELMQKLFDTAWNEAEDVCDAAEGAVELASFAIGAQYFAQALSEGVSEGMDVGEVAPLMILLGILGAKVNKDLSELVPRTMSEEEALLYWGTFQKHGLSQASFQRLLACESCKWGVAETGEVLSSEEDRSLRIVVKGSVAVQDGAKVLEECPKGMIIGETTYLGGAPLWDREAIVATSETTYVHWDIKCMGDCLAMDKEAGSCITAMLSDSMVSNFRLASRLRVGRTDPDVQEALEEPNIQIHGGISSYHEAFDSLDLDSDGFITKEELRQSINAVGFIFKKLNFNGDSEFDRLFNFLDVDRNGSTTREEFVSRLLVVEEWANNLAERDMTLGDLSFVLVRAHNQIDENGDGLISQEEFWSALQRLDLPLDRLQSNALHSYLDRDGDGLVDVEEWQASTREVQVLAAFRDIMSNHANKKGLTKFAYYSRQMQLVLQGPEEPAEKLKACLDIAWDGIESLGEVASLGLDISGFGVALLGIWQQVAGLGGDGPDQLDLAPFLLFLGVSAVQVLRKLVEESASDLADKEALLFAKAFGGTDISLSDFRKLLRQGAPRWRTFSEGEVVMRPKQSDGSMHVVMNGSFGVSEGEALRTSVENGGFLCGEELISNHAAMSAVARVPTTTLSWSADKLRPILERNKELRMKLQRAVTTSTAKALLQSYSPRQR